VPSQERFAEAIRFWAENYAVRLPEEGPIELTDEDLVTPDKLTSVHEMQRHFQKPNGGEAKIYIALYQRHSAKDRRVVALKTVRRKPRVPEDTSDQVPIKLLLQNEVFWLKLLNILGFGPEYIGYTKNEAGEPEGIVSEWINPMLQTNFEGGLFKFYIQYTFPWRARDKEKKLELLRMLTPNMLGQIYSFVYSMAEFAEELEKLENDKPTKYGRGHGINLHDLQFMLGDDGSVVVLDPELWWTGEDPFDITHSYAFFREWYEFKVYSHDNIPLPPWSELWSTTQSPPKISER